MTPQTPPTDRALTAGEPLWMVHVLGPDEIYPAPHHATAVQWCAGMNGAIPGSDVLCVAVPALWTGSSKDHAAGLKDARDAFSALACSATSDPARVAATFAMNPPMTTHPTLRSANIARQDEWDQDAQITASYRGNEIAGEVGEACNVIKKLERERLGILGSRATIDELADELADVVICADLIAMHYGIDLEAAIARKFNATSEKVGLATRMATDGGATLLKEPA